MNSTHLRWACALLGGLLGAGSAWAQAVNPLCPDQRPIRFAHYNEGGALYSTDHGGIDEDIRQDLERCSGCRFEVSVQPRARIWTDLAEGSLDMAGSGVRTAERERFVWFAPYVLEENQIVLGHRVGPEVNSAAAFVAQPQLRLGGVRSYSYSPFYDATVAELNRLGRVDFTGSSVSMFRMFDAGRFDAFIASQFIVAHQFKLLKLKPPPRIENWDPGSASESGLVMSRKNFSPARARRWQALMEAMLADGTVLRIVSQYLSPQEAAKAVFKPPATRK